MSYRRKEYMDIYRKINEYVKEGMVISYEDNLLNSLATHTDASNNEINFNYLNALKSTYSISKCYRFARYLALFLREPFHLYEGKLTSFSKDNFTHAWIETENSVYDVTFIGKWPKQLYYQLFKPLIEKDIDLKTDVKFNSYKLNNVETEKKSTFNVLEYIDWYSYMNITSVPNPYGIPINPSWNYFPQDLNKIKRIEIIDFIYNEWNKRNVNSSDDIPNELTSLELSEYIDNSNFIKNKNDLYKELIKFIVENRDIYEEKKGLLNDLSLWKRAIDGKYSGSFCLLISNIPRIINQLNKNDIGLENKKNKSISFDKELKRDIITEKIITEKIIKEFLTKINSDPNQFITTTKKTNR